MNDEGVGRDWELARLDRAVANALGKVGVIESNCDLPRTNPHCWIYNQIGKIDWDQGPFEPTRSWKQAGEILDGLRVILSGDPAKQTASATVWKEPPPGQGRFEMVGRGEGKTLLEAAMRAFVDSKWEPKP